MRDHANAAAGAVDRSGERPGPAIGRRRHRLLTGTAGILLCACMFVPAMQGCGATPVRPVDVPPFLPPYVFGFVVALVARARSRRGLASGVLALRVLATLVAFAGFVVFLVAPAVGIVELTVGLALIAAIGTAGVSEARVALTTIVMGAVCTLWFGLWSLTSDALLGVQLSLGCSVGLLLGGGVWLGEVLVQPAVILPAAVLRRRQLRYVRHHEGIAVRGDRSACVRRL